jgi:hypothetical protein
MKVIPEFFIGVYNPWSQFPIDNRRQGQPVEDELVKLLPPKPNRRKRFIAFLKSLFTRKKKRQYKPKISYQGL